MAFIRQLFFLSFIFYSSWGFAVQESPESFTFDGRAYSNSTATRPLLDVITTKIQILNAAQNCILYEETQTINTRLTNGYFTIKVGTLMGSTQRSENDSNNAMSLVFSNSATVNGKNLTDASACSYTPTSGDKRFVRILMTPESDGVTRIISPNVPIDSVPHSLVAERAETLQGKHPDTFLQVNTTGTNVLTQVNLENIFSDTNFSRMINILADTNYSRLTTIASVPPTNYVQKLSNGSVSIPSLAANPTTDLQAGQLWFDSVTNSLKFYDGAIKTVGSSEGLVSNIQTGTGLLGGPITTTGTLSVDVGTTAGKIVQVAEGDKLPVIDGSNLTNVVAVGISGPVSTKSIEVWDSDNSNKITFAAPSTGSLNADYGFILPTGLPSTSGQVLSSDTSGNLSWTPSVFSSLESAKVWVGNASNIPSPVAIGGDVTMTNAGVVTVAKVKGVNIGTTPTAGGQVLKFTVGAPGSLNAGYINVLDIRSSINNLFPFFPTNCNSSQVMTYASVNDTMTCSPIAITPSNFATQSQKTFLAGPASGSAATPSFRTITGTDLPTVSGAQGSYRSVNVDQYGRVTSGSNPTTLNGYGITDAVAVGGQSGAITIGTSSTDDLTLTTDATTRLVIKATGNIGIGTTANPSVILDVADTSTTKSAIIVPRAGNFTGTEVNGMVRYNTATNLFEFRQNGSFVNFTTVSDSRLKTDVLPVENGLDLVNQLRPVFFNWDQKNFRARSFGSQHEVGFLAQEVEQVVPEVVRKGEDSYRSLEYGKLVAVVVAAVQDLYKKMVGIEKTKTLQIQELESRIQILERENVQMKQFICSKDNSAPFCPK